MSIALTNYVAIKSGLGAGAVVPTRQLVGRLFTDNVLLPPKTFVSFTDAAQVGSYFGTTSEEYYRALFYFSWVSKNLTTSESIQYARWVDVAQAPTIYPANNQANIAQWQTISNGAFFITIGGVQKTISGLDFTVGPVADLAAVASLIQDALQALGGSLYATATVTYSSAHGFVFVAGETTNYADGIISIQPGLSPNTDISGVSLSGAPLLNWYPSQTIASNGSVTAGAIWSGGSAIEDLDVMLTDSIQQSNNFGSFLFLNNLSLNLEQITQVANFNNTENVLFLYTVPVSAANVTDYYNALNLVGGVGLTLDPQISHQYPEMVPMMIAASTDYTAQNSVQNYMYQIFPLLTPSVTDTSTADGYNAMNINYYGNTQTAGVVYSFYQQGYLQGALVPTDIIDMGPYVNEIWLKDAASAAILSLLLSLSQIPANAQGQSLILGVLQNVVNLALNNGTISVNKTLTTLQRTYISSATGFPDAWYQVQNNGYWMDCVIQPEQMNPSVYEAVYTLIYSKNDVVRLVTGTHILI